jgi:hypothetical protein
MRHVVWKEHRIRVYMVLLKVKRRGVLEGKIFKLILMGECEEDSSGSEWGTVAGSCEKDDRISVTIKCKKFLHHRQHICFSKMTLCQGVSR